MSQARRFATRSRPKDDSLREVADLALQIAWQGYDSSMADKRALDNKANMILVADGVLLGLVLNSLGTMELHLGLLSFVLIIVSAITTLHALKFRDFTYLKARETWDQFCLNNRLGNPAQAKIDTMATLDKAIADNKKQSEDIVRSTKIAGAFLVSSLIVIALAIFAHYGHRFFVY